MPYRDLSAPRGSYLHWSLASSRLTLVLLLLLLAATIPGGARADTLEAPLFGTQLRCCAIPQPPIVARDNTTIEGFSGIAIEYLRLLELKLGFRCSSLNIYTDVRGGNATFSEVVNNMANCTDGDTGQIRPDDEFCNCDMGVGGWAVNENRIGRVDFVQPFLFDLYRVMTHTNNTISPVGDVFFFTAFETTVWICVFVLIGLFAFLKLLDVHFAPLPAEPVRASSIPKDASWWTKLRIRISNIEQVLRLNEAFQSVANHMMGHSTRDITGDLRSMRQWILNVVIFLSGLFLVLTYEASMTNALVNETWRSDFEGLEDFKQCRIPANQVCMMRGSGAHSFWQNAVESRPCHQRRNAPKVRTRETFEETFYDFLHYKCKYLVGIGIQLQEISVGRHCEHLRITGEPFHDTGVSFILPRRSNITYKLSNATLELRDTDQIPTGERFLRSEGSCNEDDFTRITFAKLVWFFVLVFLASGIVLLLMACAGWKHLKRKRQRDSSAGAGVSEVMEDFRDN